MLYGYADGLATSDDESVGFGPGSFVCHGPLVTLNGGYLVLLSTESSEVGHWENRITSDVVW